MITKPPTPMTARQVLDNYFLETRAKLIEIGANLDRFDRAPNLADVRGDPRLIFIAEALRILESTQPNRVELIQRLYSI